MESDGLKQGETEEDKNTYIAVFIYFMNCLIAIQGHRRAGSLSQHALSERQGNTLDRANKETRQSEGNLFVLKLSAVKGNPYEHRKNTHSPHRTKARQQPRRPYNQATQSKYISCNMHHKMTCKYHRIATYLA